MCIDPRIRRHCVRLAIALASIMSMVPVAYSVRYTANFSGELGTGVGARKNVDNFGRAVTGADLNDDGYEDIIVAAPYYDDESGDATVYGGLYVIWGPIGPKTAASLMAIGEAPICEPGGQDRRKRGAYSFMNTIPQMMSLTR